MSVVDIWHASIDCTDDEVAAMWRVLDEVERGRASRFQRRVHRNRFVAARATLRYLLGDYTGVSAEAVKISLLPGGKPFLDRATNAGGLEFNLSHSVGNAVFAFSNSPVGIDLQKTEPTIDAVRIAARFFSVEECATLDIVEIADRHREFARIWARKEAYLKATGQGLTVSPASVSVGNSADGTVLLRDQTGSTQTDEKFRVHDLTLLTDHACAIAVSESIGDPEFRVREWSLDTSHRACNYQRGNTKTDGVGFEPTVRY